MKIAILGGSFNPVHIGHLALAKSVCDELSYDKILFVPTFQPPHKIIKDAASAQDRLEMLRLACLSDSHFETESCEIDRGGISYTYDTICYLEDKYAGELSSKIGLIFGQDLVAEFSKWNRADELAQKTDIILARRPKEDKPSSTDVENLPFGNYTGVCATDKMLESFSYPHFLLKNFLLPISSTKIRMEISSNGKWSDLVPKEVCEYIKQRKLYGYKD